MLSRKWKRLGRRIRRCLTVGFALVGILMGVSAVPVPVALTKDITRPFLCQHHFCDCLNAAQCWEHCRCFSHAEHVAWAHTAEPAHDEHEHDVVCRGSEHASAVAHTSTFVRVIAISTGKGGVHGHLWSNPNPAPVPASCFKLNHDWPLVGRVEPGEIPVLCLSHSPPTPPPRA